MLTIDIISPEGSLFAGSCDMVIVPAEVGDLGILAGHIPTIATLRAGNVILFDKNKIGKQFFLAGGFADINQTKVTILANEAQDVSVIKPAEIEKMLKNLHDDLKNAKNIKDDLDRENHTKLLEEKITVADAALRAVLEKHYGH